MKNKLLLFTILSVLGMNAFSQDVGYYYDASGNRIQRKIILLKSAKVDTLEKNHAFSGNDSIQIKNFYEDNLGANQITIFPNPTKGELSIKISNLTKEVSSQIYVYDMYGRLILKKNNLGEQTPVNLSNVPNGAYILKISIDNKITEWKVFKE